jgi:threonine-phosphate decarboxylase
MIGGVMHHGGQLREIAERHGVFISELIDFSANINPDGPPSAVLASLRNSTEDQSSITTYPDLEELALKSSIAAFAKVPPSTIAVSNGFVPLLQGALRSLRIRHCLLPVPAFVEYRRSLSQADVRITTHPLSSESGFRYDLDAMLSGDHDAILLANPQNPSGVLHSKALLIELTAAAAARNISILLDEAFIDYAPATSLADQVAIYPNLIVFRSVTKFFAVPGLRVAYAVAASGTVSRLNEHLAPWPITTLASRAVQAALADQDFANASRALNEERRTTLHVALRALELHVYPSSANFLLLRLPGDMQAKKLCDLSIAEHRLVVRDCSDYEDLEAGHIRVAVRRSPENGILLKAFGSLLSDPVKSGRHPYTKSG